MFWQLVGFLTRFLHVTLGVGTPQNFPPPLSSAEQKQAFLDMNGGDTEARQKLILHNLRLVSHIVRKYYTSSHSPEDLVSIGTLGLVKAVDTFNPFCGARFATYAAKCIQNEILMHFRATRKLSAEVSLGETIDVDRDGNPLTYSDILCSDENVSEEIGQSLRVEKLKSILPSTLDSREMQIITLRYGLGGAAPMTQRDIARQMDISRSYVSRIEKGALEKLRRRME